MRERKRFVALMMTGALALSLVGVAPQAEAVGRRFEKRAENKVLRMINAERKSLGKNELKMTRILRRLSRGHSRYDSQTQGTISHDCAVKGATPCPKNHPHNPKTRWGIMQDRGFTNFCENVAWNTSGRGKKNWKEAAGTFYRQWLNSTGHRECMLSQQGWRGTHAGVGIHKRGAYWYATFLLGRK